MPLLLNSILVHFHFSFYYVVSNLCCLVDVDPSTLFFNTKFSFRVIHVFFSPNSMQELHGIFKALILSFPISHGTLILAMVKVP